MADSAREFGAGPGTRVPGPPGPAGRGMVAAAAATAPGDSEARVSRA